MGYKKITKDTLKEWRACKDGYEVFNRLFPNGATLKTASKKLIDKGYKSYSNWLWVNCSKDSRYSKQTVIVVGNHKMATAGNWGTVTAGDDGTATAGDYGTTTAGIFGTAIAGNCGTATAGNSGTAIAAISGNYGTATAGDWGEATAGKGGEATAGIYGTATAGEYGTATAGAFGTIQIKYDYKDRYRIKIGYIGEDGLKANTPYKLDANNNFIEVK